MGVGDERIPDLNIQSAKAEKQRQPFENATLSNP